MMTLNYFLLQQGFYGSLVTLSVIKELKELILGLTAIEHLVLLMK